MTYVAELVKFLLSMVFLHDSLPLNIHLYLKNPIFLSAWKTPTYFQSKDKLSYFILIMPMRYSSLHKVTHVTLHRVIPLDHPPLPALMMGSTQPVGTASSPAAMWAFTQPDSAQFPLPRVIHVASLPPGKICIQFSRESPASARLLGGRDLRDEWRLTLPSQS